MGSSQPPIQGDPVALSPGKIWSKREGDHSHPHSVGVNNVWHFTSALHTSSCHGDAGTPSFQFVTPPVFGKQHPQHRVVQISVAQKWIWCVKANHEIQRLNLHTIGIDGLGHSVTSPRSLVSRHLCYWSIGASASRPRKPTETHRHCTTDSIWI